MILAASMGSSTGITALAESTEGVELKVTDEKETEEWESVTKEGVYVESISIKGDCDTEAVVNVVGDVEQNVRHDGVAAGARSESTDGSKASTRVNVGGDVSVTANDDDFAGVSS